MALYPQESQSTGLLPILLAVLAIVTLFYSVLIMRAPLQWASIVVPLLVLYLLWRFVRAHERIAAALESDSV